MEAEILKTFLEHCIRNQRKVSIKVNGSVYTGVITQHDNQVIELFDSRECSIIVFVKEISAIEEINEKKEKEKEERDNTKISSNKNYEWFKAVNTSSTVDKEIPPVF